MPSKKVLSVLIVASSLVACIMLASNKVGAPNSIAQKVNLIGSSADSNPIINDNWKNDLENLPPATSLAEASTTETLTDVFSRSFMANYISMKQTNTLDSTSAQKLIDQSVNFISEAPKDAYTTGNIVISGDNSKEALTKYGNTLGAIILANKPKDAKNEVTVFADMMRNKDDSKVLVLENIAAIYKNSLISLSHINVPSSYASYHLSLLNGLNSLSQSIYDFSAGLKDPMRAVRGMGNYKSSMDKILSSLQSMKAEFEKDGIIYKQGDNGYFLYSGI